ncbi:MAG: glycosyltransferase [Thermofilum sp.]|nr:glycosyltransferase [Thermofilum sp.]
MRILHVIPYFPPASAFGGPPKATYLVARELAERGHEVTVYTTDAKDLHTRIWDGKAPWIEKEVDGVKVVYFRNLTMLTVKMFKLFVTPALPARARKEMKEFDIVHLHEFRTLQNVVVARAAREHGVPYVLQAHGSVPRVGSWKTLKLLYDAVYGYKLLRGASRAIALTKAEAGHYRRMGVPEEKIAIIPNGIDLSEYSNLPSKGTFKKKFNIPEDRKIVLYLGRIHKTKGIDLLIKAFSYLKNKMKDRDTILVIAGPDDGYLCEARNLANSLGCYNSVMFTGFISSEDKLRAIVDADVFITPSFYGFPMTFLEACAAGTPIVTTSLGDTLEWIDGNVGYIAQPIPSDIAEAIYRIISDDELRRRFSRNCIEIVKSEFSIENVVERLEKVYEEVVRGRVT